MIENEVIAMLESKDVPHEKLSALADQFRGTRAPEEVFTLLCSENSKLVQIGAWIASEIPVERYNTGIFRDRLRELTNHESSTIRFYAFSALFPLLDPAQRETRDLVAKLLNDPNSAVW